MGHYCKDTSRIIQPFCDDLWTIWTIKHSLLKDLIRSKNRSITFTNEWCHFIQTDFTTTCLSVTGFERQWVRGCTSCHQPKWCLSLWVCWREPLRKRQQPVRRPLHRNHSVSSYIWACSLPDNYLSGSLWHQHLEQHKGGATATQCWCHIHRTRWDIFVGVWINATWRLHTHFQRDLFKSGIELSTPVSSPSFLLSHLVSHLIPSVDEWSSQILLSDSCIVNELPSVSAIRLNHEYVSSLTSSACNTAPSSPDSSLVRLPVKGQ